MKINLAKKKKSIYYVKLKFPASFSSTGERNFHVPFFAHSIL